MTNGSVLYHRHDGIVTLTLNRPETLNAMNEAMMGEMERILIELEADTAVRAESKKELKNDHDSGS